MKAGKLTMALGAGALLALSGASALAEDRWLGERGDNWEEHVQSSRTRVQVAAERDDARRQDQVGYGDDAGYPHIAAAKSSRSREEVRADAAAADRFPDEGVGYSGQ